MVRPSGCAGSTALTARRFSTSNPNAPPRAANGRSDSRSASCCRDQRRSRAVKVGEQSLQILDLRQIVDDDIGVSGVTCQEILMIILGRIEVAAGFNLGDDLRIEHVRLVELDDVSLGNM